MATLYGQPTSRLTPPPGTSPKNFAAPRGSQRDHSESAANRCARADSQRLASSGLHFILVHRSQQPLATELRCYASLYRRRNWLAALLRAAGFPLVVVAAIAVKILRWAFSEPFLTGAVISLGLRGSSRIARASSTLTTSSVCRPNPNFMNHQRTRLRIIGLSAALFFNLAHAAPVNGDMAPDVLGTDLDGQSVSLANYAGKPVVVSFWATWCTYCLKELPILEGIQKSAGADSIQVIAVNTESRDVFRKAARAMSKLSLKLSHDTGGKGFKAFGVSGIPHMVIIGRDGKIYRVYRGYDESALDGIVADINAVLASPR